MEDFQDRQKIKNRLYSKTSFVILLLLVLLLLRGVWGIYNKARLARENLLSSAQELASLEHQKDILSAKVASLKTQRGIEAEIRQNFPVVKKGEKVIEIINDGSSSSTTTATSYHKNWWQWLWGK